MADEQVGNSSWQTMTPGSAAAGQLQNILTQKRLEARQAMLDDLTSRNVESQITDRDRQAATNEEYRQGLIQNRKAQELQRITGLMSPGMPFNDTQGADYKFLKENAPNLINPATQAQPNFDFEGQADTPASPESFRGTGTQLEAQRKLQIQQDAQAKLADKGAMDKLDPLQKEMLFRAAYNASAPTGVVNPVDRESWEPVFDANGNDTGNWAPKDTHFLPHEPKDPVTPAPVPYEAEDAEGNVHIYNVDRNNKATEITLPTGLRIMGRVGTVHPPKPAKGVSDRTKTGFAAAKQAWLKSPNDATKEAMLKQLAAQYIGEFPAEESVRQHVLQAYSNPGYRNLTLDQFKAAIDPESDPKNAQDAMSLWQQLVQ